MLGKINYRHAQTVLCTGPFPTSYILYRCSCVPMKPALPLNHFFSCCMAIIRSDISKAVNRLRKHNNESFHHFYSLPPSLLPHSESFSLIRYSQYSSGAIINQLSRMQNHRTHCPFLMCLIVEHRDGKNNPCVFAFWFYTVCVYTVCTYVC